jgi:anti-sigma B factor antagonist
LADSYVLALAGLQVQWNDPGAAPARIHLEGELDNLSAPVLRQAVESLYAGGCSDIRLDLGDLRFIDSTGLGLLVAIWRHCDDAGGRATVVEVSDPVRRLMDVTGISVYLVHEG